MAEPAVKMAVAEVSQDEPQDEPRDETLEQPQDDADPDVDEEAMEKVRREREARAQALTLEMVGDLPYAEVKPPENILFVCKLNPVTQDEDLELIFSRFGKILSCEVIRDKRTGDSLQYAFIEYENLKDCERAYSKMHGVLIDDHRIHVDFSQSVSKLSDIWRKSTNAKRAKHHGGFGGISGLEKKRHYRAAESIREERDGYGVVLEADRTDGTRRTDAPDRRHEGHDRDERYHPQPSRPSRSRSPRRRRDEYADRTSSPRDHGGHRERSRSPTRRRDEFADRRAPRVYGDERERRRYP